jgi:hypothetical protein
MFLRAFAGSQNCVALRREAFAPKVRDRLRMCGLQAALRRAAAPRLRTRRPTRNFARVLQLSAISGPQRAAWHSGCDISLCRAIT